MQTRVPVYGKLFKMNQDITVQFFFLGGGGGAGGVTPSVIRACFIISSMPSFKKKYDIFYWSSPSINLSVHPPNVSCS